MRRLVFALLSTFSLAACAQTAPPPVEGGQKISVGDGVDQQTTVYQLRASERIEFRSPGGSIVLDAEGITLNGLSLTLLGPTKAGAKGAGNALALDLAAVTGSQCEERRR